MAQDLHSKRLNIASEAVLLSTKLVDAINGLLALKAERSKLDQDFQSTDFDNTSLSHLTSGMVGTLFDFVIPSLKTNYDDLTNGGRNEQILLQVRS